jgi:hypothetical protein
MNRIFADIDIGRKNLVFGIALFVILGLIVGIPLTINFFGGSVLADAQYQTWKVVHGYGVFLGFINYFFGLLIDRLELTKRQKEISSWSVLIAGFIGGIGRMILVLLSVLGDYGIYASLGEVIFITLGTLLFLQGQIKVRSSSSRGIHVPHSSVHGH